MERYVGYNAREGAGRACKPRIAVTVTVDTGIEVVSDSTAGRQGAYRFREPQQTQEVEMASRICDTTDPQRQSDRARGAAGLVFSEHCTAFGLQNGVYEEGGVLGREREGDNRAS